MKAWIAILTLTLTFFGASFTSAFAEDFTLRHFKTDYCTLFPTGTRAHHELWKQCCIRHDLFLWAGGTYEERLQTDRDLKKCVLAKGAPVPAWIMYLGVRAGSRSPIRYKDKEWGNAWTLNTDSNRARFQSLTRNEIALLILDLSRFPSSDLTPELYLEFVTRLQTRN